MYDLNLMNVTYEYSVLLVTIFLLSCGLGDETSTLHNLVQTSELFNSSPEQSPWQFVHSKCCSLLEGLILAPRYRWPRWESSGSACVPGDVRSLIFTNAPCSADQSSPGKQSHGSLAS